VTRQKSWQLSTSILALIDDERFTTQQTENNMGVKEDCHLGTYECSCGKEFVGEEGTTYICPHCHRKVTIAIESRPTLISLVTSLPDLNYFLVWLDGKSLGTIGPMGERKRIMFEVAPGHHVLKVEREGVTFKRSGVEMPFTAEGDRRRFLLDGTLLGGIDINEVQWGFK
jgi:hypothetical protein